MICNSNSHVLLVSQTTRSPALLDAFRIAFLLNYFAVVFSKGTNCYGIIFWARQMPLPKVYEFEQNLLTSCGEDTKLLPMCYARYKTQIVCKVKESWAKRFYKPSVRFTGANTISSCCSSHSCLGGPLFHWSKYIFLQSQRYASSLLVAFCESGKINMPDF